jgi:hypothetical protein
VAAVPSGLSLTPHYKKVGGGVLRDTIFKGGKKNCSLHVLKDPMQSPPDLLVEVNLRKGKAPGSRI